MEIKENAKEYLLGMNQKSVSNCAISFPTLIDATALSCPRLIYFYLMACLWIAFTYSYFILVKTIQMFSRLPRLIMNQSSGIYDFNSALSAIISRAALNLNSLQFMILSTYTSETRSRLFSPFTKPNRNFSAYTQSTGQVSAAYQRSWKKFINKTYSVSLATRTKRVWNIAVI